MGCKLSNNIGLRFDSRLTEKNFATFFNTKRKFMWFITNMFPSFPQITQNTKQLFNYQTPIFNSSIFLVIAGQNLVPKSSRPWETRQRRVKLGSCRRGKAVLIPGSLRRTTQVPNRSPSSASAPPLLQPHVATRLLPVRRPYCACVGYGTRYYG